MRHPLSCLLGVITNLVLVPPMRYRSAEYSIRALSRSLCDLLTDIAEVCARALPSRTMLSLGSTGPTNSRAPWPVEHAAETMRFNPRRLFLRTAVSFDGHRAILNALDRATEQARSATRAMAYTTGTYRSHQQQLDQFLTVYGRLLNTAAEAARALGKIHSAADTDQADQLDDALEQARGAYDELVEQAQAHELD